MANHNTQRYYSMRDAYQQVYMQEGVGKALKGAAGALLKGAMGAAKKGLTSDGGSEEDNEASGGPNRNESVSIMPMRAPMVVKHTTNIDLELTPEYKGPGEVSKAYYTYPAGFDPTGRQDIVKDQSYNGSEKRSEKKMEEEVEYTDLELVCDMLLDEGLVEDAEGAEAFWNHMSDEWRATLLEKKGRCWTGYKPTPGKEPYSDGSCEKA